VCRISPPGHTLVPGRMPSPSEMDKQAARGFPNSPLPGRFGSRFGKGSESHLSLNVTFFLSVADEPQ
jgi:hypothetical protein